MELDMLNPGRYKAEEVVVAGNMAWAKVDGKWCAMTYRSSDPMRMRNREERSSFARAIGVPVKDVENYVRRKRREEAKESLTQELREARLLLQQNGYNVIDTKDR